MWMVLDQFSQYADELCPMAAVSGFRPVSPDAV